MIALNACAHPGVEVATCEACGEAWLVIGDAREAVAWQRVRLWAAGGPREVLTSVLPRGSAEHLRRCAMTVLQEGRSDADSEP